MKTKPEEINEFMQQVFAEQQFEDTSENRLAFLEGLKKAWDEMPAEEDHDQRMQQMWYKLALSTMIMSAKLNQSFSLTR